MLDAGRVGVQVGVQRPRRIFGHLHRRRLMPGPEVLEGRLGWEWKFEGTWDSVTAADPFGLGLGSSVTLLTR